MSCLHATTFRHTEQALSAKSSVSGVSAAKDAYRHGLFSLRNQLPSTSVWCLKFINHLILQANLEIPPCSTVSYHPPPPKKKKKKKMITALYYWLSVRWSNSFSYHTKGHSCGQSPLLWLSKVSPNKRWCYICYVLKSCSALWRENRPRS